MNPQSQSEEASSSEAGTPEKKASLSTAQELKARLIARGWKDGNAEGQPKAYELRPERGNSNPSGQKPVDPAPSTPPLSDRTSPESIKQRLGASLFLQTILEEELQNAELPSSGFTTNTPESSAEVQAQAKRVMAHHPGREGVKPPNSKSEPSGTN